MQDGNAVEVEARPFFKENSLCLHLPGNVAHNPNQYTQHGNSNSIAPMPGSSWSGGCHSLPVSTSACPWPITWHAWGGGPFLLGFLLIKISYFRVSYFNLLF